MREEKQQEKATAGKLSDAYLEQSRTPMLELTVKVININLSVNHPILQKCRPLYEYSCYMLFTEFNMEDALDVRYEEGVQAGIQEGSKKVALETAKCMLQDGRFTPEEIAGYVSGLTVDDIIALK